MLTYDQSVNELAFSFQESRFHELALPWPNCLWRQWDITSNWSCRLQISALKIVSNNGEPFKRSRSEEVESSIRNLELDLAKYDSSYRKCSHDDLVKIFELGRRVRESVNSDRKYSDDDLVEIFELGLRVRESASLTFNIKHRHALRAWTMLKWQVSSSLICDF